MASSSDVVKKVMRFKLQLTGTAESTTVLKILQKLKDLDITLDILAETGIGKTVNSLRRHEQAGEFAKSLVRGWKRLVPKESTSQTEDGDLLESLSVKDKLEDKDCPSNGSLTAEDLNNNFLTYQDKSQKSLDEALFKTENREANSEKQHEEQRRYKDHNENQEKCPQENYNDSQHVLKKKIVIQEDKMDNSVVSNEKTNDQSNRKSGDGDILLGGKNSEDTDWKSRSDSKEKMKSNSDRGRLGPGKESNRKSNASKESLKESKESFPFESSDKYSKTLKLANVKDDRSSGIPKSSEAQNRKRKKTGEEKHATLKFKHESENKGHSKHKNKKAKIKHEEVESDSYPKEPSMSFESCLNYDDNVLKRKERSGVKKPSKRKNMTSVKEATKDPGIKAFKSPVMPCVTSEKQFKESVMDLMNTPLPAVLPECEKPSSVEYFERKVERESDFCDVSEESAVFTGQRLNKKMQVYSGAKTIFLPTMMSLHQQCIRTLQNNINLLYETGGVPFEILEPVLERCTPEQLLRIEECNPNNFTVTWNVILGYDHEGIFPGSLELGGIYVSSRGKAICLLNLNNMDGTMNIYVGVTDHLWGKHCQKEFKDSKLQEYESWKEMYIRLSEEREMKLQRLTKSIVSAHSNKPRGRQVKMAFIHTVAKPPRDVRIQQEIHGTAVQQPPQQLRCSAKVPDNRSRPISNEPSRSSSTASGSGNTQDPRKKTRVAPMMAKSLKAFKKQLGRR